jgi:MoaA/NifB/PqqE/SkfB family radical SAM enzyme
MLGEQKNDLGFQLSSEKSLGYMDFLYKSGVKIVLLMGGEPLLYPAIYKLIEKGGKLGHKMHVAILTNGVLLDNKVVQKLKNSRVSAVQISIDGVGSIYKEIRGVDFRIIDESVKRLKKNKIPVLAKFTLNSQNIDEFIEVWEYCKRNKIRLTTSLVLEAGRAKENLVPSPDEYFVFFKKMFWLRSKNRLRNKDFVLPDFSIEEYLQDGNPETACVAGRGVAGITKDNKFVPCIYLSSMDTEKLFGINPPDFKENFLEAFNEHPLFVLFRQESSELFGCPIRRRIYGGIDPFSVYEFAKNF